jgi:hypothetical protein
MKSTGLLFFCFHLKMLGLKGSWLPTEAIEKIIAKFELEEVLRRKIASRGPDRRPSSPFISGTRARFSKANRLKI